MPAVQTTYSERMAPPGPGTISGSDFNTRTGLAEVGAIPFGRAVTQGTLSDKGVVLGGASVANFLGVSIKDQTLKVENADAYVPPNNVGILSAGEIWLEPSTAVLANDPVYFATATGLFSKAAGAGIVGPVKGARWVTSCGVGGRAIAHFIDYNLAG